MWERQLFHSVAVLFNAEIPHNARILDIGTGGGFPGIPMKICRPDLSVILIDSINFKKIAAVQAMIDALTVINNEFKGIGQRVRTGTEDFAKRHGFRHAFDAGIARAVAPLETLVHGRSRS